MIKIVRYLRSVFIFASAALLACSAVVGEEVGLDEADDEFEKLVEDSEAPEDDHDKLPGSVLMEAEDFEGIDKDGKGAWRAVSNLTYVSRQCIQQTESGEISQHFKLPEPGRYRVWVRYFLHPEYSVPFSVRIDQDGKERFSGKYHGFAAGRGVQASEAEKAHNLFFDNPVTHEGMVIAEEPVWEYQKAELSAGEGRLVISTGPPKLRDFARRIDCVLLTRSGAYRPNFRDFQDTYVRFRPVELEPEDVEAGMNIGIYWAAVRIIRGQQKVGDGVSGILDEKGQKIRKGVWSQWVNLREKLEPGSWENTVGFHLQPSRPVTKLKAEIEVGWGPRPGQIVRRFFEEGDGPSASILLPNRSVRTRDEVREGIWSAGFRKWISCVSDKSRKHYELAKAMEFKGDRLPRKYTVFTSVTGYGGVHYSKEAMANEMRAAAHLGINAPFLLCQRYLQFAREQGLMDTLVPRVVGGTAGYPPRKGCPNDPATDERCRKMSKTFLDGAQKMPPDGVESTWMMKNGDEIGFTAGPSHVQECETCVALFRDYLKGKGLSPAEFGAERWSQVRPRYDLQPIGKVGRRLHYHTTLFLSYNTAQLYRKVVASHESTFASKPYIYSNYQPSPIWSGMGLDWFIMGQERAFSIAWAEDWVWGQHRWELVSFVVDVLRNVAEENGIPFGMYIVARTGGFRRKTMSLFGRGALAMIVYNWGPRYAFADQFSEFPEVQREVGETMRLVGGAEDYLFGSRPLPTDVALVYSRSEEIWQADQADFKDRLHVYLALLHDQIPADVISEDQIAAGKLSRYKVLYLCGEHIQKRAAEGIRDWVAAGGRLWADGQAATRDEYDEPLHVLDEVLGRRHLYTEKPAQFAAVLGHGTLGAPIQSCKLKFPGSETEQEAETYVYRAVVEPGKSAKVVGTYADGRPAAIARETGEGRALYLTFPAGMTYRRRLDEKDFDPSKDYRSAERSLISGFALESGVVRPVELSHGVVEAIATRGEGGRTVVLINYRFEPVDSLGVSIREGEQPIKTVRSVLHGPLQTERKNGRVSVTLPLDEADVLLID